MSGIACIVRWDGGLAEASIAPMLGAMHFRAPDADSRTSQCWTDGRAAMGCVAYKSNACIATSSSNAIIWSGRLHRRDRLLAHIAADARSTDAALVLAAYEARGTQCVELIEGEYAFAIWNGTTRELLCVRDRVGARPLVTAAFPGGFLVASDTQAIRASGFVRTKINEQRVAEFLLDDLSSPTSTFYNGIERVAAASVVTVSPQHARARTYWRPPRGVRAGSDGSAASVAADVARFRELFDDAVAQRMPGDQEIGVLLSGGLDSSSIVCSAARTRARAGLSAPWGISAVYDRFQQCDERPYIEQVCACARIPHTYFAVDADGPLSHTEQIIAANDEPPWMPNLFMLWQGTLPAARDAGVGTLLDGIDGDTVVAEGEGRIHDLLWSGRLARLWGEVRPTTTSAFGAISTIVERGIKPRVPLAVRRVRRALRGRRGLPPLLLRQDVRQRTAVDRLVDASDRLRGSARDDADAHWLSVTAGVNSYAMEVLERSAAAHGLELQHPFYDHRLIEHCVTLDSDRKVRNGETRWILREAMADVLPPGIRNRHTKSDLSACFDEGVRVTHRDRIDNALSRHRDRLAAFVEMDALDAVHQRFSSAPLAFDGLALWKTALLGTWIEHAESDVVLPASRGAV